MAGAGKTTLMAQVAGRLGEAAGWYRVTADDGSAEAMVAHLARALGTPGGVPTTSIRYVHELLAAVDRAPVPRAVFLDDLHEIRGSLAESALERFIELRPPEVRVVLGSRTPPLFNLPKLRVSGQIVEIGNEDLRFRSWEVERALQEVYGEPLPPESAAALSRKIGGWAAGLQLFHLATTKKSTLERCRAVADLDGRSHLIRSYLARNVVAELSEEERRFLIRSCTLGLLTAPLCDALLGTTRSAEILAQFEESQLFTSSDDDGFSYRYHHVLQAHLELALVEELGPRLARSEYARSAALLEAVGATHDALRAYARAEDWPAVARVLRRSRRQQPHAVGSWEDLIPPDLRLDDPWFAVAEARRLVRRGLLDDAVATYRRAESLLSDRAFQEQCAAERRLASAWTVGAATRSGRPDPDSRRHWGLRLRAATRRLPRESASSGVVHATASDRLASGLSVLLAGDLAAAADELEAAVDQSEAGSFERSAALLGAAVTDLAARRPEDADQRLEAARRESESGGFEWLEHLAGSLALARRRRDGWTHRDAVGLAQVQPAQAREGDLWGPALDAFIVGVSREFAGEEGSAQLLEAARRFEMLDALVLQAWARAGVALGAAWRGTADAAGRVAEAEADVRRAGAPGPQALLAAATALSTSGERSHDLAQHAEQLAVRCGFDPTLLIRSPAAVVETAINPTHDPHGEGADRPHLQLTCFGGFRIRIDSVELNLTGVRPRARALLRLLALSAGADVHREYIIGCLWPGISLASATRSLQVNVSSLRQAFESAGLPGQDVLARHGDAYRLALPEGSTADLVDMPARLRQAVVAAAQHRTEEAAALRHQAVELLYGGAAPRGRPGGVGRGRARAAAPPGGEWCAGPGS